MEKVHRRFLISCLVFFFSEIFCNDCSPAYLWEYRLSQESNLQSTQGFAENNQTFHKHPQLIYLQPAKLKGGEPVSICSGIPCHLRKWPKVGVFMFHGGMKMPSSHGFENGWQLIPLYHNLAQVLWRSRHGDPVLKRRPSHARSSHNY